MLRPMINGGCYLTNTPLGSFSPLTINSTLHIDKRTKNSNKKGSCAAKKNRSAAATHYKKRLAMGKSITFFKSAAMVTQRLPRQEGPKLKDMYG
jgi:hypothetical protein